MVVDKMQDITNKKEIGYPTELTFKAIFRNNPYTLDSIKAILTEEKIEGSVNIMPSKNSKFISYTINAVFPSEDCLNRVCSKITTLDAYMTMF